MVYYKDRFQGNGQKKNDYHTAKAQPCKQKILGSFKHKVKRKVLYFNATLSTKNFRQFYSYSSFLKQAKNKKVNYYSYLAFWYDT